MILGMKKPAALAAAGFCARSSAAFLPFVGRCGWFADRAPAPPGHFRSNFRLPPEYRCSVTERA
jgi:hypothetical protein